MNAVTPTEELPTSVHSRLGPSSSDLWMNCAGQPQLIKSAGLGKQDPSEPAARGSVFHHVAAECLMTGAEPWEFAGQKFKEDRFEFEIDSEAVTLIENAVSKVLAIYAKYKDQGAVMYCEATVQSEEDIEAHGTADVRIEVPGLKLILADFKFGFVRVEPDHHQLRQYGYYSYEGRSSALRGAGQPKTVEMIILQPRLPNPADHLRKHEETPEELHDYFHNEVLPAMVATRELNAPLTMGKHCTWCPALNKAKCPAWIKATHEVQVVDPAVMTNEQLGDIVGYKGKMIEKFIEASRTEALARARMGQVIPGKKIVYTSPHRALKATGTVTDENGAEIEVVVKDFLVQQYGDKAYDTPKLLSPAGFEKLPGGKGLMSRFAYKPPGSTALADDDDHREQAVGMLARMDQMQEGVVV